MLTFVLPVAAYLLGSVSTAVIASRALGLPDPRHVGSGNPGATNMLRVGGRKAAIITLLGDVLKGLLPVILARGLGVGAVTVAAVALAAFIGHIFPAFFRLRGGKGVATAWGALTGISPWAGLALLGTWLGVALIFRYSSLAALVAAVVAPFFILFTVSSAPLVYFGMTVLMSVLLLWRHQPNIRKLLAGEESRIGAKGAKAR
ncbi:MAG: glycerol-3-phosphate 1-O-acyltransferase PlsY [Acidiferrobacter sp.]